MSLSLYEPSTFNLLIHQAQPFYRLFRFKQDSTYTNLLTYTFDADIRNDRNIDASLVYSINCSVLPAKPTELILKIDNTLSILPNCLPENIPDNFSQLNRNKLQKSVYFWSLRCFLEGTPVARLLEGCVLVTPETSKI
jgi:hypothetical protein